MLRTIPAAAALAVLAFLLLVVVPAAVSLFEAVAS